MFWRKNQKKWDLNTVSYISGRIATKVDGSLKKASFVAPSGKTKPSVVKIPQYGWYIGEHGHKAPIILIQAEELIDSGETAVGIIDLSRDIGLPDLEFNSCLLSELELLGEEDPRNQK